jgi:hypothetical protein
VSLVFASHVRQGYAASGAGQLTAATDAARLSARLRASVNAVHAPAVEAAILGPGDVGGIPPDQIARLDPEERAERFETTRFACIEFERPDLPWMFTPLTTANRLQPWIVLAVVPEDEATVDNQPGRVLTMIVDAAQLPPLEQSWAWAHVQLPAGAAASGAPPKGTRSRLVCPRQLRCFTRYLACVVPAFEAGRLAGVGSDAGASFDLAWTATSGTVELPVYKLWRFSTGEAGDFESLARNLTPLPDPPDGMGIGRLDVSDPGPNALVAPGRVTELLGALAAPGSAVVPWPQTDRALIAGELVPAPGARILGPPVYGALATGVAGVPETGVRRWLGQLNLHPARRAGAGIGAAIVRRRQDDFVQEAWEQAGAVEEANRRLDRARLGRRVSTMIERRHVTPRDYIDLLHLAGPVLGRLAHPAEPLTFAGALGATRLPVATLAPGFRRLLRPTGPLARRGVTDAVRRQVVGDLGAGTIVPDRTVTGRPGGLVTLGGLLDLAAATRTASAGGDAFVGARMTTTRPGARDARIRVQPGADGRGIARVSVTDRDSVLGGTFTVNRAEPARLPRSSWLDRLDLEQLGPQDLTRYGGTVGLDFGAGLEDVTASAREEFGFLVGTEAAPPTPPMSNLAATAQLVATALSPALTLAAAMRAQIVRPDTTGDGLEPVMVAPSIPEPLWDDLAEHASDLFLPGASTLPPEHATVVSTNPPFVAGFLAGANEEMMRELRWRAYPTDGRGTVFRRFWDRRASDGTLGDDLLEDVDAWRNNLADDVVGGTAGELVLVIRSDIFRRYPGTLVFAVPAIAGRPRRPDWAKAEPPSFHGQLPRGVAFYGFPVTITDAVGDENDASRPGWFIVFNQPDTDLGFGIDEPQPEAAGQPPVWLDPETFGADAAAIATATAQFPIRLAIHASDLVGIR